jgi:eukaryotic-like serine/threonine-protein kinase
MDSAKWKQVKSIFNEASELPKDARPPFLADFAEEIRLEVEKMLAAIEAESLLLNEPIVDFRDFAETEIPDKIGDYKIIREIGHGGMGTVYEALRETESFKQRVALKIIKRGMNNEIILKRFRAEQQILATLEHPNIGRFLDGGKTADGLPFYAMEFIEGVSIDEFCGKKNLEIEAKVKLFREVCSAVSYAHTNLIVHRDLKPSNIIVSENGTPKLLDFGIAKVLDVDSKEVGTATQLGMMTPQYASPEQIRGEKVTTLSDVYSLGVIFYEILTGEKPYEMGDKNYAEILEIITQTEPHKPSTNPKSKIQNPKLNGDLDIITLKSLQKSPERRYQSVQEFSEDLRRHLFGLPITARPDTLNYRLSKFVERNKVGVAAGALVLLSLLGGIGMASWQAYRAQKQRLLAEKRFAEVRTIANDFVYKYTDEISALPNSLRVREQLLRDGSNYLDKLAADSAGDLALQFELAQAYKKLGDLKGKPHASSLGDTKGAIESYEKAINLLENVYQNSTGKQKENAAVELIGTYRQTGITLSRANEDKEKRQLYRQRTQEILNEIAAIFPENNKFKVELIRRQEDEAEKLLKKDFAAGEKNYNAKILPLLNDLQSRNDLEISDKRFISGQYSNLSWLYGEHAKLLFELDNSSPKAGQIFQKSLEFAQQSEKINSEILQSDPQNIAFKRSLSTSLTSVASAFYRLRRFDESWEYLQRALVIKEEIAKFDSQNNQAIFDLGAVYSEFGLFYNQKGDFANAIIYSEKSVELFEKVIANDSKNQEAVIYQIDVLLQLADSEIKSRQSAKALETCRKAENIWQKANFETEYANNQLGQIYLKQGIAEADKEKVNKSIEIFQKFDSNNSQLWVKIAEREAGKL